MSLRVVKSLVRDGLPDDMRKVLTTVMEMRESMKKGCTKDGDRITNPILFAQCLKDKEQVLGRMLADYLGTGE